MRCPHLSVNDGKNICKRMVEEGMNGEVSEFDVQHYCNGNPVNCYYFRRSKQTKEASETGIKHKLSQIFTAT